VRNLNFTSPSISHYKITLFTCVFLGTFSWLPGLPSTAVNAIKYISFIILLILSLRSFSIKLTGLRKHLAAYAAILFPPYIYHLITTENFNPGLVGLLFSPLLVSLALNHQKANETLRISSIALIYSMLVHSAWIIVSYITNTNPAPFEVVGKWSSYDYSVMGFTNSHTLASPLIAISIGLITINRKNLSIPVFVTIIAYPILLAGLLLSTGEGGALVLVASLGCIFVAQRIKAPATSILFAMLISASLFFVVGPYLSEKLHSSYIEHYYSNKAGWEMLKENPIFGVGLGQSYYFFERVLFDVIGSVQIYSSSLTPHTPYGVISAENGLFGIIAIALLVYVTIKSLSNLDLNDRSERSAYFIIGFMLILSSLEPWPLISNFFALYIFYAALSKTTNPR